MQKGELRCKIGVLFSRKYELWSVSGIKYKSWIQILNACVLLLQDLYLIFLFCFLQVGHTRRLHHHPPTASSQSETLHWKHRRSGFRGQRAWQGDFQSKSLQLVHSSAVCFSYLTFFVLPQGSVCLFSKRQQCSNLFNSFRTRFFYIICNPYKSLAHILKVLSKAEVRDLGSPWGFLSNNLWIIQMCSVQTK